MLTGPLAVDAAVGGVEDGRAGAGAGDRDVGEAAFLLEAGEAAFVQRALRREHAFFPAGEEDQREFEALGGVDGHDRDLGLAAGRVIVHHQADMLEEGAEGFIFLHRAGELGEVFEAAGGFGAALGLEHRRCSRFRRAAMRASSGWGSSLAIVRQRAMSATKRPRLRRACGVSSSLSSIARGGEQERLLRGAGEGVDVGDGLVAEAALGDVDDAFEGEVVGRLGDQAQVGERVADLGALVEAEAADDLVGEADGDEALLELAGLELGADEDRGSRRGEPPLRWWLSISSPTRRASSGPSHTPMTLTGSPAATSVHRVLPRRPALWAMRPVAAARMCGVER